MLILVVPREPCKAAEAERSTSLGDRDRDRIVDVVVVGASEDDDGGHNRAAVWVLFLNRDGTVKSHQKIRPGGGDFPAVWAADPTPSLNTASSCNQAWRVFQLGTVWDAIHSLRSRLTAPTGFAVDLASFVGELHDESLSSGRLATNIRRREFEACQLVS